VLSDRMVDIGPSRCPTPTMSSTQSKRRWPSVEPTALPQRLGSLAAERPSRANARMAERPRTPNPLVIIHNSGHKAYFNSAAATGAGRPATPLTQGASYGTTQTATSTAPQRRSRRCSLC